MGALNVAMVFIWVVNILIFMTQAAMIDIGPESTTTFYNCSNTILKNYVAGANCQEVTIPNTEGFKEELPVSVKEVDKGGLFGFLDSIATARNWITEKIDYIIAIASGPYVILNSIPGLPKAFVGIVDLLWYGLSVFLLINWILGKDA